METALTATVVRHLWAAREVSRQFEEVKQIQIIGVVSNGIEHVKGKGKRKELNYKGSVVWFISSLSSLTIHSRCQFVFFSKRQTKELVGMLM